MAKFAAIDVGSNAIRLLVVELSPTGLLIDQSFKRYAVRLGADAFALGKLAPESIAKLTGVFEKIDRQMKKQEVESYRAVATSAMRTATNGAQVARDLKLHTGIALEIIDGEEEAHLARDALVRALGSVSRDTLLIDLGGGSLELQRAGAKKGQSVPFGTVRLLKRFPAFSDTLDASAVRKLGREIRAEIKSTVRPTSAPQAIGTGGNLEAVAALAPSAPRFYPAIELSALEALAVEIAAVPLVERVERYRLRPDRVDLLVPAILVIAAVGELYDLRQITVPKTGLREEIVRRLVDHCSDDTMLTNALKKLGAKRRSPIASQAEQLFDLLAPISKLWAPAKTPLLLAACLLESGAGSKRTPSLLEISSDLFDENDVSRIAAAILSELSDGAPESGICALPSEERSVGEVLAGILELSRELARLNAKKVTIDLQDSPVQIQAGLSRTLPQSASRRLSSCLSISLRIR